MSHRRTVSRVGFCKWWAHTRRRGEPTVSVFHSPPQGRCSSSRLPLKSPPRFSYWTLNTCMRTLVSSDLHFIPPSTFPFTYLCVCVCMSVRESILFPLPHPWVFFPFLLPLFHLFIFVHPLKRSHYVSLPPPQARDDDGLGGKLRQHSFTQDTARLVYKANSDVLVRTIQH